MLLPDRPDLDWLRKQAKRRLASLREMTPDARLSEAQFQLAREYGFASWRALKAHVDEATVDPLLSSALRQAEEAAPAVRAAVLAHIARVASVRRQQQAMELLERGIAIAETLREPVRHILLGEAHTAALEVSPERAMALLDEFAEHPGEHYRIEMTLQRLLEHGFVDTVIGYLLGVEHGIQYPYDVAGAAIHAAKDPASRIALLRRALRAVRSELDATRPNYPHHPSFGLLELFNDHWRVLPPTEAATTVRELVDLITAAPDQRESYSGSGIHFSSTRQRLLFQLLSPCRQLEPQLADALVAAHPQLARAAARFPDGLASLYAEPAVPPTNEEPPSIHRELDLEEHARNDYLTIEGAFLPVEEELRTNFERAFTVALSDYESDTNPRRRNSAPQVCWPSAAGFRSILYKAGTYEGLRAERHLARIPDGALRLLSQIELAAALAGVRQAAHSIMRELPELPSSPHRARRGEHPSDENHPFDIPTPVIVFDRPQVTPSYEARIAPTRHPPAAPPAGGCDADFWVIENVPLRPVLSHLFEMAPGRISIPPSLDKAHYDFTLVLPRDETREVLLDRMRSSVGRYFSVRRERREVGVQVVTAPRGITARERPAEYARGGGFSGGTFEFSQPLSSTSVPDFGDMVVGSLIDLSTVPSASRRPPEEEMRIAKEGFLRMIAGPGMLGAIHQTLTMRELCIVLESGLRKIFVDETGTTEPYDVHVGPATAGSSGDVVRLVCEELGLVVTPARRVVEMLIVSEP